jgi:hypothetical protein
VNIRCAFRCFSGITFIGYTQNRKVGKSNNLKLFGSNKTKGHKQDRQNLIRSPMREEGEP